MRTARTAAVLTGSGILRRVAGSSTHNCRGILAPAADAASGGAVVPRRLSVSKDLNSPSVSGTRGGFPPRVRSTRTERFVRRTRPREVLLPRTYGRTQGGEDSRQEASTSPERSRNEEFQPTALCGCAASLQRFSVAFANFFAGNTRTTGEQPQERAAGNRPDTSSSYRGVSSRLAPFVDGTRGRRPVDRGRTPEHAGRPGSRNRPGRRHEHPAVRGRAGGGHALSREVHPQEDRGVAPGAARLPHGPLGLRHLRHRQGSRRADGRQCHRGGGRPPAGGHHPRGPGRTPPDSRLPGRPPCLRRPSPSAPAGAP